MINDITTDNFDTLILSGEKPKIVKVFTDSCPNCSTLEPIFIQTEKDNKGTFEFYNLDAKENMEIAKRYKVMGVPALLFFIHGKMVDKKVGVLKQSKIEKRLAPLLDYTTEMAAKKEVKGFFKMPWS